MAVSMCWLASSDVLSVFAPPPHYLERLAVVGSIQGPGMLGGGHQIATDAKGNIDVAATTRGLQKLVFKGLSAPPTR